MILLLYNGTIYTLNPEQPEVKALAIRDGRIVAMGSIGKVRAAIAGERVEGIDLNGRAVIPGLVDAHVHITWHGLTNRQVNLGDVRSLTDALGRIASKVRTLATDEWLLGGGWNHVAWGSQWPTRTDIDHVCSHNPAMLVRKDGHSSWVNSRALKLAGIDSTTADPPGGQIQRDQDGEPTGILLESAQDLVRGVVTTLSPVERRRVLQGAIKEALSYGLTGLHIPPGPDADDANQTLTDLQILYAQGALPLRCLVHLAARDLDAARALGLRSGLGDRWLRIGGLKIFADGSLGSESAEMLGFYEGRRHTGMATMPVEELEALIQQSISAGISVVVHAIGDAANRKVLNAIEKARQYAEQQAAEGESIPLVLPNSIEHAQLVHPSDIARFAPLGVIASMQPLHATCDMEMADELWGRRCETAYALRSFQEAGATLALGSDAPVEALSPWPGIHAAVTRQRANGTPAGGWYPEQRLSLLETLRGYCIGPALASSEAAVKGMLAPGKLADMVVLAVDPFRLPPTQLHGVVVDMTIVEGQVRWER